MDTPTPTPDSHMTGRLRFQVKMIDAFAEDDRDGEGTEYERDVAVLLEYVATAIVNGDAAHAANWLRITDLGTKPRADRVQAAREAATTELDRLDRLDLPDSYSGVF